MNGTTLSSVSFFTPGQVYDTNWRIVATNDLNADGKPDLLWWNQASGQIGVWFIDGATLSSVSFFTPGQVPDTNWKIPNIWN